MSAAGAVPSLGQGQSGDGHSGDGRHGGAGRGGAGMVRRLTLGPLMILVVTGLLWADESIAGAAVPGLGGARVPVGALTMAVMVLLCARAGTELARLMRGVGLMASPRALTVSAIAGVFAAGVSASPAMARGWSVWGLGQGAGAGPAPAGALLATAAVAVVFGSMVAAVRGQAVRGAAGAVAGSALAFVYAGMTIGFLMALRAEHSAWVMGGVIAVIKACDIGAYFSGTFFGRRKLIPWLSPGKTWEGLAGGVVASCAVALGLVWVGGELGAGEPAGSGSGVGPLTVAGPVAVAGVLGWADALALGVSLALAGQLGDLSASVLKRDAGVKDAGRIVPGFGGVIDVLDSLLIAGPVAFWYLAVRVWAA